MRTASRSEVVSWRCRGGSRAVQHCRTAPRVVSCVGGVGDMGGVDGVNGVGVVNITSPRWC